MPFTRDFDWTTDAAAGVKITASRFDTETDNVFSYLNQLANSTPQYAADTGAADAYVVTLSPAPASYATGLIIRVKITNTNTGASTINANALGAKAIQKAGNALAAGDLTATRFYELIYDGTQFQILSSSNAASVNEGGTGLTSYTQGDILYASAATTLAKLAKDANATRYLSNTGSSNNPAWAQVALATGVSGDLPFANMVEIATDRLVGRDSASTGDMEELTVGGGVEFTGSGGIQRSALTGDVTASAGSNSTTIANDAVTYAKMQNVSATSRVLGRKTSGAGDAEECTLSEVLDFIGSAAQGDILYRGAAAWARLAAGTSGQLLTTAGGSSDPAWGWGAVVQRVYAEYTTNAAISTAIAFDDSIPQISEGTEIMTAAITPKSASNRIRIRFQGFGGTDIAGAWLAALFVDATANALSVGATYVADAANAYPCVLEYEESAASTSARTYRIRVGGATGTTLRLNGTTAGRQFGGVMRSTLIVEEIA